MGSSTDLFSSEGKTDDRPHVRVGLDGGESSSPLPSPVARGLSMIVLPSSDAGERGSDDIFMLYVSVSSSLSASSVRRKSANGTRHQCERIRCPLFLSCTANVRCRACANPRFFLFPPSRAGPSLSAHDARASPLAGECWGLTNRQGGRDVCGDYCMFGGGDDDDVLLQNIVKKIILLVIF